MKAHTNNRRDFIKKLAGTISIIGAVAVIQSCEKNNDAYSVNSSSCNGCGKCVAVCGANAISLSNNKASISSSKCAGCGKCARICPEGAIS